MEVNPTIESLDFKENPNLGQILDTDDRKFATKIAGVTYEEWFGFQQWYEKSKAATEDDVPYGLSQKSMRGHYRRLKKRPESKGTKQPKEENFEIFDER